MTEIDKIKMLGQVEEFHQTFEHSINDKFTISHESINLRMNLINEEYGELLVAINNGDEKEVIDALLDLTYVSLGSILDFGLKEEFFSIQGGYDGASSLPIQNFNFYCSFLSLEIESLLISTEYKAKDSIVQSLNRMCSLCAIGYRSFTSSVVGLSKNGGFLDFQILFSEVHKSNMSKLCKDTEDADKTVDHYKSKFPEEEFNILPKGKKFIVKRGSDGKICKSVSYTEFNIEKHFKL